MAVDEGFRAKDQIGLSARNWMSLASFIRYVEAKFSTVSFKHYDLGYFDLQSCKINPVSNPFSAKVLPMSPE